MKKTKNFIMTSMNGMAYGLFSTLIIGVIISQFGKLLNIDLIEYTLADTLKALMGIGIGIGISISLKKEGLKFISYSLMGAIATSFKVTFNSGIIIGLNNDPLTTYLVVILGILILEKILIKKTPVDLLLIPLLGSVVALLLTLVISAPVTELIYYISTGIEKAMAIAPIPMSIIISISMGMLLTSPLSSAAIAITINLGGFAGGAAVVGTTVQMVGFAVQSIKDNDIGVFLSVFFGTSMLQFKNILRKPLIWLPTIIASGVLAPIFYLIFKLESTPFGAGMGTSGLVGILQTLEQMNYSSSSIIGLILLILSSAVVVYLIDLVFRKYKLIEKNDFLISKEID